jgi:uncharacterized protein with PIN domain
MVGHWRHVEVSMGAEAPRFACDAMLGGLAKWLRAAGYDAAYEYGIDDGDLIRLAAAQGRILLTSDGRMMERNVLKTDQVPNLFIHRHLPSRDALAFVLRQLNLPLREPRCMACGGELTVVAKESIQAEAPPKVYESYSDFFRCARCGKLLWQGTHWKRISKALDEAGGASGSRSRASEDL